MQASGGGKGGRTGRGTPLRCWTGSTEDDRLMINELSFFDPAVTKRNPGMKAFLSHSSKDKNIVREVAKIIGESRCQYDEYTFEYTLTQQAIRRALSKSNLFVLFLSESSIKSSFVDDEIRSSFEFRGRGLLENFLIIALDSTSFKALPEWLQAYNIVNKLHSPASIAQRFRLRSFLWSYQRAILIIYIYQREDENEEATLSVE